MTESRPLTHTCKSCNKKFKPTPSSLRGYYVCPKCVIAQRSRGVSVIANFLRENEIKNIPEYTISSTDKRRWDFFLPDYKAVIEYDGQQHFSFVKKFHGDQKEFEKEQLNDIEKTKLCIQEGYQMIRLDYLLSDDLLCDELMAGLESPVKLYVTHMELYSHIISSCNAKFQVSKLKRTLDVDVCNAILKHYSKIDINYYFWNDKKLTVFIKSENKQLCSALEKLGLAKGKGFMYTNKIDSEECKWLVCQFLDFEKYSALEMMYRSELQAPGDPSD